MPWPIANTSLVNAPDPRQLIIETIIRTGGVLSKAAHDLGIGRVTLYRHINSKGLWPVVNQVRKERLLREEIDQNHYI